MVKIGIDRIAGYDKVFKGKEIGLITNFSGVSSDLVEDMDVFAAAGFHVSKLYTPEHGLYGAMDGETVDNMLHPKYGTPMISLYGDHTKPTAEELEGVEVLVYDIQDVGLRYYTYIYTMCNCMQAAAELGIPFVILDRPNPLGSTVAGCRISTEFDSFVGAHRLATRYGLTCGELGFYFKEYFHMNLDLTVIEMEGYRKDMMWPETGQLWNMPSPSIHTFNTILCYYGGCFYEATNISEGRGTSEPFQIYGAPFVHLDAFIKELKSRVKDDKVAIRPRAFTPFWSKHQGKTCFGAEFIPLDQTLDFMPTALTTMKTFMDMYPEHFEFVKFADVARLTSLSGDPKTDDYLAGRLSLQELMEDWKGQAEEFAAETQQFRIYQ